MMTEARYLPLLALLLGAVALWLLLPGKKAWPRRLGGLLGVTALGLVFSLLPRAGQWAADSLFLLLAAVAIFSAAAAISFRNPVYCALWFGQTLLAVAGLLWFLGAQFLAFATVVVYVGAILVLFLFVLMLAQPEGRAACDRISFESQISSVAAIVIVGWLAFAVGGALSSGGGAGEGAPLDAEALADGVLTSEHVWRLGTELFTQHFLAIQLVGVLLLVALVGAAVIVSRQRMVKKSGER